MAAILSRSQCVNMYILTIMYDCWSDVKTIFKTIFTSLTSSDLRIGLSLRIGFMSRLHHSILSIISFTYVTLPYNTTNAYTILYNMRIHIKWKSINAMCFHLVKNGLWRFINQSSQQYLHVIHFPAFAVLVMPWWRRDDWRVPQECISAFIVNMFIRYWGYCGRFTLILIINLDILEIRYVLSL